MSIPPKITRQPYQRNPKLFELLLPAGSHLFREGDPADCLYVVQEGAIDIVTENSSGRHVLATLHSGSSLGEQAVLGAGLRNATALAQTDTICLEIPSQWLRRELIKSPALVQKTLRALMLQLSQNNFITSQISSGKTEGKLLIEAGSPSATLFKLFLKDATHDVIIAGSGKEIDRHLQANSALVVSTGELRIFRNDACFTGGEGTVLGLAQVIGGVKVLDRYEVTSPVTAWIFRGDPLYKLISQLNSGLSGVFRGVVCRAIGVDSVPRKFDQNR